MGYGGNIVLDVMTRALGRCPNSSCQGYNKILFIPCTRDNYGKICSVCGRERDIVKEHSRKTDTHNGVYRKVIVYSAYDFKEKIYRCQAIVEDEALEGGTLEVWTPMVPTERKALKMAESLFAAINLTGTLTTQPIVLDFEAEDFGTELLALAAYWSSLEEKLK
jgi:hypothetical protein